MSDGFAPPSGSAAPLPPPPGAPFAPPATDGLARGQSSVFIDHAAIRAIREGVPLPSPAPPGDSQLPTNLPRRRRRRVWPWLALAGLTVIVGAVVAWRITGGTEVAEFPEAIDLRTLQPALPARLIFDEPPPGADLSMAIDLMSDDFGDGSEGVAEPGPSAFYAAPDANLVDGRWVAITTRRSVPPNVDPDDDFEPFGDDDSEIVEINGIQGTYVGERPFVASAGQSHVMFGPLDGYEVSVVGSGLSRDELIDVASGIRLRGNGIALRSNDALAGFERRHLDLLWIGSQLGDSPFADMQLAASMYGELGSDLVIMTRLADPATFDERWTFAMTDERPAVVRGTNGWIGRSFVVGGQASASATLVWNEGGREVAITISDESSITMDQVLAAVETIREATDQEWDRANGFDGVEEAEAAGEPSEAPTLIIGEGTFSDSTSWIVTLSLFEDEPTLSVSMVSASSNSESESPVAPEPTIHFETIDGDKTVLVGIAPTDVGSATLEVTTPAGRTFRVPLVESVGTDLLSGAIGIEAADFSAELIDMDGAVIAVAGVPIPNS